MKFVKVLLAVTVAVALLAPAAFPKTYKIDNLGRKWLVDEETAATPGAGAGEGAVIGLADEVEPGFNRHMIDLQFGLSATGVAADDSAATEQAVTTVTLQWYPPTSSGWLKLGPRVSLASAQQGQLTFSLPITAYLFPDPFSTFKWGVELNVLPSLSVITDPNKEFEIRESAWNYVPALEFFAEVPMGSWSFQVGVGGGFPVQLQGVSDEALNSSINQATFGVGGQVNWRLGR